MTALRLGADVFLFVPFFAPGAAPPGRQNSAQASSVKGSAGAARRRRKVKRDNIYVTIRRNRPLKFNTDSPPLATGRGGSTR